MTNKIPPRDYLTFVELMARWQSSENDLSYAIISGALKPSIVLNGMHKLLVWETDDNGVLVASTYRDRYHDQISLAPKGWHYLQEPMQTESFDCQFLYVSDARDPVKCSDPLNENWHSIATPMTLNDVKRAAVFLVTEVENYESQNHVFGGTVEIQKIEMPLGNREHDTLLKLVIGMAIKGYRYDPAALKSTVLKEIVTDLADLGISIDTDTVRKHLKKAANTVLPAKPRQP